MSRRMLPSPFRKQHSMHPFDIHLKVVECLDLVSQPPGETTLSHLSISVPAPSDASLILVAYIVRDMQRVDLGGVHILGTTGILVCPRGCYRSLRAKALSRSEVKRLLT